MLNASFTTVVYGMLQYYGVISVTDLFVLCNHCHLCTLNDYKWLLQQLQVEQETSGQMFLCKKLLCHKSVENPMMMRDLQKSMVAGGYKIFLPEKYWKAGNDDFIWSDPLKNLMAFLKAHSTQSDAQIQNEIARLWLEINNMTGLVLLTTQCAENLALPWTAAAPEYMKLLEAIRKMAEGMPRWCCKGYSHEELRDKAGVLERK